MSLIDFDQERGFESIGPIRVRGRRHNVYAPMSGTRVEVRDEAGPFLARMAATFPAEFNKSLASLGFILRNRIRQAMISERIPGGWPERSGLTTSRLIELAAEADGRKRFKLNQHVTGMSHPYGELVRAVAYRRDKARGLVQVGFMSARATRMAIKLQGGFTTTVTRRMQGLFAASGAKVPRVGKRIVTPGRPVIKPIFDDTRPHIGPFIERKIHALIRRSRADIDLVA